MAGDSEHALTRLIRWTFLATAVLVVPGLLLVIGGWASLSLAGWGAAYVAAAGLWVLAAAALSAAALLVSALVLRVRYGRWYFGVGKPGE